MKLYTILQTAYVDVANYDASIMGIDSSKPVTALKSH